METTERAIPKAKGSGGSTKDAGRQGQDRVDFVDQRVEAVRPTGASNSSNNGSDAGGRCEEAPPVQGQKERKAR